MPRYRILVREVHVQPMLVADAGDAQDAIRQVAEGGGEIVEDGLEYSHTLDPKTWTAEEVTAPLEGSKA